LAEHNGQGTGAVSEQRLGEHNGQGTSPSTSSVRQTPMPIPAYTLRTLPPTRKNLAYGKVLPGPLGMHTTGFGYSVVHTAARNVPGSRINTTMTEGAWRPGVNRRSGKMSRPPAQPNVGPRQEGRLCNGSMASVLGSAKAPIEHPTRGEDTENFGVPEEAKSTWYIVIHDTAPTNERLHKIRLSDSDRCRNCDSQDTLVHRLKECGNLGGDAETDSMAASNGPAPNTRRLDPPAPTPIMAATKTPGSSVDTSKHGTLSHAKTANFVPARLHRFHAQGKVEVIAGGQPDKMCGNYSYLEVL
jgi:hypothetical protein